MLDDIPTKKHQIGILAFGSLIADPGEELTQNLVSRLKTETPFTVEYGRYSGRTRGGAPTLIPHQLGAIVNAEILVLSDMVSFDKARDMLWRRETRKIDRSQTYVAGAGPNNVLVRTITAHPKVETLHYTDFNAEGKISHPSAAVLADRAIASVREAEPGMDGISYLVAARKAGIETPLTKAYADGILLRTQTVSLPAALAKVIELSPEP